MNIFSIGFTKKSAQRFFDLLRTSGTKRIVDVRLNNVSQLAGFAKRDDLIYFLREICGIDYLHLPELAPTKQMLDDYRKEHKDWNKYEGQFLELMRERCIESKLSKEAIAEGCLLCSEDKPHYCHRRLVAQYLDEHWGNVKVRHLG
ncbi:MAG: DUF488 domain-containing protein [bacterium]|nr:DUF488 domain-containing protein [bacterium]